MIYQFNSDVNFVPGCALICVRLDHLRFISILSQRRLKLILEFDIVYFWLLLQYLTVGVLGMLWLFALSMRAFGTGSARRVTNGHCLTFFCQSLGNETSQYSRMALFDTISLNNKVGWCVNIRHVLVKNISFISSCNWADIWAIVSHMQIAAKDLDRVFIFFVIKQWAKVISVASLLNPWTRKQEVRDRERGLCFRRTWI